MSDSKTGSAIHIAGDFRFTIRFNKTPNRLLFAGGRLLPIACPVFDRFGLFGFAFNEFFNVEHWSYTALHSVAHTELVE